MGNQNSQTAKRMDQSVLAERVRLHNTKILSNEWGILKEIEFDFRRNDGCWQRQSREIYERGAGAVILPYNEDRQTVILIRQFRLAPFLNGYPSLVVEAPAGLLNDATPEARISSEVREETGYRVSGIEKVFEAYMIPGFVTERLHFFIGSYAVGDRIGAGGGEAHEGEDIEVLEIPFGEAQAMARKGEICDGKTIMLIQHLALTVFNPSAGSK